MDGRVIDLRHMIAVAGLLVLPAGAVWAGPCPGESASASGVLANQTVTLNPGGGVNDPLLQALVVFTNGPDSEPATVTVCQVSADPHPGALGYIHFGATLTVAVAFQNNDPDNQDTYVMRVMVPFAQADLPGGAMLGPAANELTFFNASGAWVLATSGNSANSPGFAEAVGDRFTVQGTTPPVSFSSEPGDYGVFWHTGQLKGFVWANADHATDFAPGAPMCWSDIDGNGIVDTSDFLTLLNHIEQPCVQPPIGCIGDIFFDGFVDFRDLAQLLAFFGGNCFLVPDTASILHSILPVDNSSGAPNFPPGFNYLTGDLQVAMNPDNISDWWTTTEATAQINDFYGGITYFQHSQGSGGCGAPNPFFCPFAAALRFDTYVIEATELDPCSLSQTPPGAYACSATSSLIHAKWYDRAQLAPPGPGDPPFSIARFTYKVQQPDPCTGCQVDLEIVPSGTAVDPVLGTIAGTTTHRFGLSNLIPFSFDLIDRCAADINHDGTVDVIDFLSVLEKWGATPAGHPADLNRNGVVDVVDFLGVLARWGPCT